MIDSTDICYKQLTKAYEDLKRPLFSQFFEHIRVTHNHTVKELACKLQVDESYIIGLENGDIWANINHINLNMVENIFGLKKNSLRKYLKYSLIER